jgi:DNA-binding winged helix-turn-helix (wHTH) protein
MSHQPTTVLLLGQEWEEVQLALTALASEGSFVFRTSSPPPAGDPGDETAHPLIPTVIMIGPGADYDSAVGSPDFAQGLVGGPPVLACVTHDSLENADLYENADDFLLVPCSSAEMEKRIRRLALKSSPSTSATRLSVGEIILDLSTYQITVGGNRVDFAWLEFQLLKFLMENVGRVFSRQQLLTNVWGVDSFGGTRTVDVHIRRLRNKVEVHGNTYFRTVKNVGYGMTHPT